MNRYRPSSELRHLIDRMLDVGPLSRMETARLEELLEDDAALEYYLSVTQQDAVIGVALAGMTFAVDLEAPRVHPFLRLLRPFWRPLAAAAIFTAGFFTSELLYRSASHPMAGGDLTPPAPLLAKAPARITGMMGVVWQENAEPDLIAVGAAAGRVAFQSGLVEITYSSGVRVTLEGPADFRVIDAISGKLTDGRMVASVPHGAEGFQVDYAHGKVVDLGTEFGLSTRPDGTAKVGVFVGKVELHVPGTAPTPLYGDQAVLHDPTAASALTPISLGGEKFVRSLPNREFLFKLDSTGPVEKVFDVSHLVRKASDYRVLVKWLKGNETIYVGRIELRCNGELVVADEHLGVTGYYQIVRDNLYRLNVSAQQFRTGRWELHMTIGALTKDHPSDAALASDGIVLLEEGLVSEATADDFIGRWAYRFEGHDWIREFHADGTSTLVMDGVHLKDCFVGSRWTVEEGVLRATVPERGSMEEHVLRDRNTLIFKGQPYENARRLPPG
jgi:hypothetical protein